MNTDDQLLKLFEAERAVVPPGSAVDHGWQRLAHDLAANIAPLPVAAGPLKLGMALLPKWLVAGFLVGLAGAGASATLLAPPDAPKGATVSTVHTSAKAPAAIRAPLELEVTRAPSVVENRAVPRGAALPAASPAASEASVAAPSTFDAELELITFAKSDLDAHRPEHARRWLAEHAQRFPNGVFTTERDALTVLASCEQGPKNAALAKRFAVQHPGSPLIERVTRACRQNADPEKPSNDSAPVGEPMTEPSTGDR